MKSGRRFGLGEKALDCMVELLWSAGLMQNCVDGIIGAGQMNTRRDHEDGLPGSNLLDPDRELVAFHKRNLKIDNDQIEAAVVEECPSFSTVVALDHDVLGE
jgi:hypothetical protein